MYSVGERSRFAAFDFLFGISGNYSKTFALGTEYLNNFIVKSERVGTRTFTYALDRVLTLTRGRRFKRVMIFDSWRSVDHFDEILHVLLNAGFQLVNDFVFDPVDGVKRFVICNMLDSVRYLHFYKADGPLISTQMNFSR